MAIDPGREDLLSLTEATKVIPKINRNRIARSTLWRWCRKGLRGVHLEYVRVGRDIATSREALNRFFVMLAETDPPLDNPGPLRIPDDISSQRSQHAQKRAFDRAERRLEEAGI